MGVNIAAFVRYFVRSEKKKFLNLALPLLGFVVCLWIWLSLRPTAQLAGGVWLAAGFFYGAWKTNWFRQKIEFAAPDEEKPA
jgi:hypothetical protein